MTDRPTNYLTLRELLNNMVDEPYSTICAGLLAKESARMRVARGSTHNHQAWYGGYLDHVREIMNLAVILYATMNARRHLPFSLSDALLVLFLHDLEKPWAYMEVDGEHVKRFKTKEEAHAFRMAKFAEHAGDAGPLPEALERAVFFTEGEITEYSSKRRVMSPLAAFCHMCDVASARIWFDRPTETNDLWPGAGRLGTE